MRSLPSAGHTTIYPILCAFNHSLHISSHITHLLNYFTVKIMPTKSYQAVEPLGKALYPYCLVPQKGLKAMLVENNALSYPYTAGMLLVWKGYPSPLEISLPCLALDICCEASMGSRLNPCPLCVTLIQCHMTSNETLHLKVCRMKKKALHIASTCICMIYGVALQVYHLGRILLALMMHS